MSVRLGPLAERYSRDIHEIRARALLRLPTALFLDLPSPQLTFTSREEEHENGVIHTVMPPIMVILTLESCVIVLHRETPHRIHSFTPFRDFE